MTDLAPFTGFSEQQKAALAAPLNADNVKERDQAGRTLSYLEGWRAIEEANRIFGFDGWDRQTVDLKLVAEHPRKIGRASNQRDGWGVSYIAKVQVVVRAGATYVTREGTGVGHGIDVDCGLAHESAIKEAETDAMKRALITFGNQFGLALYDKAEANVVRFPKHDQASYTWRTMGAGPKTIMPAPRRAPHEADNIKPLPKKDARTTSERLQAEVDGMSSSAELVQWGSDALGRIAVLPEDWVEILKSHFAEKLAALRQRERVAANDVIWDEAGERPATKQDVIDHTDHGNLAVTQDDGNAAGGRALPARIQRNLDRLKPKPDGVAPMAAEDNGHRGFTDRRYIQALRNGGIADRALVARAHREWARPAGPSKAFLATDAGKPALREGFDERNPPPHEDIPDHAAGKALNRELHPMNDRLPGDLAPDPEPPRAMLRA